MRCIRVPVCLALMGLAALVPAAAWASLFEPVSDRQLICETKGIIRGEIVQVASNWEGNPEAIWTRALIRIEDVLRGDYHPGDYIEVKEIGGTVGEYTIVAHQFPTFREGEEVVIMVSPWDDGSNELRVHGFGRGLFSVRRSKTGPGMATRYDAIESRRPVMHVDRIPAVLEVETLEKEMRSISARCDSGRGGGR